MSKIKGLLLALAGVIIGYLAVKHGPALVRSVRLAIEDSATENEHLNPPGAEDVGYHRRMAAADLLATVTAGTHPQRLA